MPFLAIIAAAGLVARAAAAPTAPLTLEGGDVHVSADEVRYDVATGRVLLEGNAVVTRGAIVLRARSATWDPRTDEVRAAGGVLLTDAQRAISADAIRAIVGGELEAEGVLAFVKDQPVDLSGIRTTEEARRAGRNRLTFSGARLLGDPDGRFRLDDARLTLCDCAGGAPSWEVSAREADVIPGKRAILRWPVLRITPRLLLVNRPVPVLALPWLYLPLGDRQSGLLFPSVGSRKQAGFTVAQPLYLTLGRSADATLTPEYAFGRARGDVAGNPAVRGPGARLELRWAPAEASEGRLELAWMHDLDAEPGGEGGDRWALALGHGQRLGARTELRAALRLLGDPVWERDTIADDLARTVPYRRSDLLVSHGRDAVVLEAGGSYVQPLRPGGEIAGETYGPLGAELDVASRWAAAGATFPSTALGPLRLSGRAGAARFASASGVLDVVDRPAVARSDARAELALPLLVGGAITFAPWVGGAALGYAFEGARDAETLGWGLAGATLSTEVSRRVGALTHAVAPRLEWRAGTATAGQALPFPAYDAFDRAAAGLLSASPGPFQQLRAGIETRLDLEGGTLVRAEVGQDLDLREGRFAETFAAAALSVGPVAADARVRFFGLEGRGSTVPAPRIRSPLDELTEVGGSASLSNRRGDALRVGFFSVGPGGSGGLLAGIDPLFDVRATSTGPGAVATAGLRAVLGTATVGYDVRFPGRASFVESCVAPGGERRVDALQAQEHAASLAWESPCRCFRIVAVARVNDCRESSWGASIDLSRVAGAALGR